MDEPRPQLGVGAFVRKGDALLLVKRGTPPSQGLWAIPGGRVHWGETLQAAAEREILEETAVRIRAREVIYTFEFIDERHHYVVLDLAADYLDGEPRAGDDASEARWVPFAQMAQLALTPSTHKALCTLYPEAYPPSGG